ncbi:methyltransferase domain-containing protein [Micromonospora sp. KC207]|uniref:class I SAM-dependent methyltransferase n=1 Tax=Micromonospora sp. KC207 TaxID=2530377 RepID=UPI001045E9BD|nr:class I SAM-dependent methyltransferase [Micromonospora sp. KC207]TDC65126.1 methyltransferase domain-containing protein [Micromonospora sp. KC207]
MGNQLIAKFDTEPRRAWAGYHRSGVDGLISSFNLAYALVAARRTGMLDKLAGQGQMPIAEIVGDLDEHLAGNLLRYLDIMGVVRITGDVVRLTDQGVDVVGVTALAQLEFYIEAYGPVVSQLTGLLTGEKVYGRDVTRNGAALGRSCADLFRIYHDPIVLEVLSTLDVRKVLDLGCGAGQFLLDACRADPALKGVGLDIDAPSIDIAKELARDAGLENRLGFVVADAFSPDTWPEETQDADAVFGVGVLHEHFRDGEDAVLAILNRIAGQLRAGYIKSFILGEPELHYDQLENDCDLYLVHIFTAQGFPRERALWLELFEKSDLYCRRVWTRPGAGPRFNFYDLVPR